MKIKVITIFPHMFSTLKLGIMGKALHKGLWDLQLIDLTAFSVKKKLDDTPFGGGEGMVIMPEVLEKAIECNDIVKNIFFLSPRGKTFNQEKAREMSNLDEITFICGRYEGIDQRIISYYNIIEISIGDFILCGGEIAACAIIESIVRILPGILHNKNSAVNESFTNILLEHNHYTQLREWKSIKAPEYLKTGHGHLIWAERFKESVEITKKNRPDLFERYIISLSFKIFLMIIENF